MATNNDVKSEKPNKNIQISFLLFIILFVITIGLYFYNGILWKKVEGTRNDISQQTLQINHLKQDRKIDLYTLVSSNGAVLEKYKKLSNIPTYINNLKTLESNYRTKITGFSYNSWKIVSKVLVNSDATWAAFVKTKNFLEYFRKQDEDIFLLDFVNAFQWQNEISFQAQFELK